MSQYPTLTDLVQLGAPSPALSSLPDGTKTAALVAASAIADSYLAKRYTLPLVAWGQDLVLQVVKIARRDLFNVRGRNPAAGADIVVDQDAAEALQWLRDVSRGIVEPQGIVDSTPAVREAGPLVSSEEPLGWAWGSRIGRGG